LTRDAVRSVEPRLIEVARMLGLSRARQIATIAIPAALPRIFTALRLTLGIALIVAVTTEITANPIGLGYAIISAGLSLRPEAMYAFLVWLAVLGWLLNAGLIALHRRLFGAAHGEVAA
jgi:ABC-type nitrate/sulfonate/bicarbonate transport system permease component